MGTLLLPGLVLKGLDGKPCPVSQARRTGGAQDSRNESLEKISQDSNLGSGSAGTIGGGPWPSKEIQSVSQNKTLEGIRARPHG